MTGCPEPPNGTSWRRSGGDPSELDTSGHPDPITWATTAPAADPADRTISGLPFCSLWTESVRNLFCKAHETRWRMQGRPEVEGFIARCLLTGRDHIDFSGLSPQLKLDERLDHCQGVDHDHWRPARTSATISSEVDPLDRSRALSLATISASVGPAAILDSSPATKDASRWTGCV